MTPPRLTNPSIPQITARMHAITALVETMEKKPFSELGLSPELLRAVEKMGYEEASPIQTAAIPVMLSGVDMVGQSQTGSGKTAAFAIPAIERVDISVRAPQVLILCPTRELAVQVAEEVAKLALFKRGVREVPIYGGQSYDRQIRGLKEGAQIVIGTPGRVIDLLERRALVLDQVKMVILDEADRMLDMGFRDEIEGILSATSEGRQTVFFSATMPVGIKRLIERFGKEPRLVKIETPALTAPAIEQSYYEVDRRSKVEVLARLIDLNDFSYGLIFCGTKMMADELTEQLLARGYAADKLHGDMSQPMRERVLNRFRKRTIEFLVATDVAARGIDVDNVSHVINYDIPIDPESYVHRIGRTGRAGATGIAIAFCEPAERSHLKAIEKLMAKPVPVATLPDGLQALSKLSDPGEDSEPRREQPRGGRGGRAGGGGGGGGHRGGRGGAPAQKKSNSPAHGRGGAHAKASGGSGSAGTAGAAVKSAAPGGAVPHPRSHQLPSARTPSRRGRR